MSDKKIDIYVQYWCVSNASQGDEKSLCNILVHIFRESHCDEDRDV